MGTTIRKKTSPNKIGLPTRPRRRPSFIQTQLGEASMEGRIIAIVKTKINPNKKYRAAEKLFNSPHIPIPSSMRANRDLIY
jgi:hypothetical protein